MTESTYAPPPPDPAFDPDLDAPHEDRILASEVTVRRQSPDEVPSEPSEAPPLSSAERAHFAELINIGKRTKIIDVFGHPVEITTLNVDEDIRVQSYTRDYLGSDAYGRAYQLATCAAAVRAVDGKPLYTPLSAEQGAEAIFAAKLAILGKYTPLVLSRIYNEQVQLDAEAATLIERLGKSHG